MSYIGEPAAAAMDKSGRMREAARLEDLAPIALFAFRRLALLKETVAALQRNELATHSRLFVFSDGARSKREDRQVSAVRDYLRSIVGFSEVTIVERDTNVGLQQNMIRGVREVVGRHGNIIVVEDDLVTSPGFLRFMNEALTRYRGDDRVICVSGYSYFNVPAAPSGVYFVSRQADCLGWATWKRGWDLFEQDGKKLLDRIRAGRLTNSFDRDGAYPYTRMLRHQVKGLADSWAIRWYASAFLHNKYTVYPQHSLVVHIGNSSDATNYSVGADDPLDVPLYDGALRLPPFNDRFLPLGDEQYREFVRRLRKRPLASLWSMSSALSWRQPSRGIARILRALARAFR